MPMDSAEVTLPALHSVGSKVWLADANEGWIKGEVTRITDDTRLSVLMEDGSERICTQDEIPLQNPGVRGVEDMTTLNYLNEPSVLWNLKVRYQQDDIYTYTGSILIAVNPFAPMPHLYGTHMMEQYREVPLGDLSPHVYAVADAAYSKMMKTKQTQSILVSGESGAGKTEKSKLIMQYLAWRGGMAHENETLSSNRRSVEQQVLESNPLLEAFGNAKTMRNDNSSRFGKFMEIQFGKDGRICGAAIRTYLLERSRVVRVNNPERNYHVFYQLCDGASPEEREMLQLKEASHFRYLNSSSCYELKDVSNAEEYENTRRAMTLVGIRREDQDAVFKLVAAILHLGNIEFEQGDDEAAKITNEESQRALMATSELLGVDAKGMERILTTRTRQTPEGPIASPIDVRAAENNRDSLAKTLYSNMFDWLVEAINLSIGQSKDASSLVGVLDIYGFEQFTQNDFEQLCINLANEKLQQHFNQHVFKMEQAEYERESIEWSYIEFVDNQDVLDLLEGRLGVLDLLDETCRFPKATHNDFAQKLYSTPSVSSSTRFSKPRLSQTDFTISHYAGGVTYQTNNFLEKNADFVVAEHYSLLSSSTENFLKVLFPADNGNNLKELPLTPTRGVSSSFKFSSVASRFKTQLADLMVTLRTMEPHYIRCIKPNSGNQPMEFENANVLMQLRCGGVLEAVRISCAGYPTKPLYEEFVDHFWPLTPNSGALDDRALTQRIVSSVLGTGGYQFGKTRVFLRAGKMAELDKRRTDVLNAAAIKIQTAIRGWMAREQFKRVVQAVIIIQANARGYMARTVAYELRRNRAAIVIQSMIRQYYARKKVRTAINAATFIQRAYRWYLSRKVEMAEAKTRAATIIQSNWRRYCAQKEYVRVINAVIIAQCAWRQKLARRELRRRRTEAKESGKLLQDKQALEIKVRDLQKKIETLQRQRNDLRQQIRAEKAARELAEKKTVSVEKQASESALAATAAASGLLEEATASNGALVAEVDRLKRDLATSKESSLQQQNVMTSENQGLKAKLVNLEQQYKELMNSSRTNIEDLMKRLNNAIAQRDEAREEVLISQAKIKQFQQQLEQRQPVTPTAGLQPSSSPTTRMDATAGRENAPPTAQRLTSSRSYEVSDTEILSEMDRRQRELYNKQQKLLREQRENDQKRLLGLLQTDLGFQDGRPVAAVLIFRCCLHWKAFQANSAPLFDRINQTMGEQVENLQEDNNKLAYWLSNTVALLYLLQKYIKPAASSGSTGRQRHITQQNARGIFGSAGKSISAYFGIGMGSPSGEASIHGGATGGTLRQVEAKYPALLFKQQLDAFVQRIFPMPRDNIKKEIMPYLGACIQAPRGGHGGRPLNRKAPESSVDSSDGSIVASWRHILSVFDKLLVVLQENHVSKFMVRKLFEQLFNFVNVQLFNQLLLRRDCCTFSNGEYIKTGLAEVELWGANAGREWVGDSWEMLAHIRQAVGFLVIHQKAKKTLSEITQDLCPALSVQQLYRISTMYYDDCYGTETVSHEVLSKMKQLMVEGVASSSASHSFLLDDESMVIPFTQEDISTLLDDNRVLADLKVPKELKEVPSFAFLEKSTAAEIQTTTLVN